VIADLVFEVPLSIAQLLTAERADDAVAQALRKRRNAAFLAERAEGHAEGLAAGRRESIQLRLAERHLVPTADQLIAIRDERDVARLERWLRAAASCASVAELLALA
jgi:hypothetical protein